MFEHARFWFVNAYGCSPGTLELTKVPHGWDARKHFNTLGTYFDYPVVYNTEYDKYLLNDWNRFPIIRMYK
jgi:hypothetical protein